MPASAASSTTSWIAFAVLIAGSWAVLLAAHGGDEHLAFHGAGASFGPVLVAWLLMAVAMMAPTAVPVLATLRDILHAGQQRRWWWFLGGYVAMWWVFALVAAGLQWWLTGLGLVDEHGRMVRLLGGATLLIAGLYQFSSLKEACLSACTSPMQWFLRHWRDGDAGAARMGVHHGLTCVGCCWALMLLAFVGGVSSLWIMAVAALVMAIEKVPAWGRRITVPLGVALVVAGVLVLLVPARDAASHRHATSPATSPARRPSASFVTSFVTSGKGVS